MTSKKPGRCVQLDKEELASTFLQQIEGETGTRNSSLSMKMFSDKEGMRSFAKVQPYELDLLSQSLALKQVRDQRKFFAKCRGDALHQYFRENKNEKFCHMS